jgi:predicted PurR-regulated permease PerM
MMGFDAHAARAAWSVFLVGLLLAVIYLTREVLLVFVLAILFAYLLSPMVNLVDRFLPWKRSRAYSLALVYVLLVGILIGLGALIGNKIADEASTLQKSYPTLVDNLKRDLADPQPAWLHPLKQYFLTQINERAQSIGSAFLPLIRNVGTHIVAVLSSAVFVVLIPILSFFFLKDGRDLKEAALSLAGHQRPMWEDIVADLHVLLGQFIRALVILAAATLLVYTVFLTIIGLPYSVLLASFAALLEFIPVVGPIAAAVSVILAATISGTGHILVIVVFLAVYRLFQDYVLSPHLMSAGIALHPLLVIFGALAGEEVAGIPGMFLSVPVLATLRVVYFRIQKARARRALVAGAPAETPQVIET